MTLKRDINTLARRTPIAERAAAERLVSLFTRGGFLVTCPRETAEEFRKILQEAGIPSSSNADWHSLRIESGWPLQGVDFDGSNLPQEVGRDVQAINFRKGCYLGQETIARIDALGHVNKRLTTIRAAGEAAPIPAGEELHADGQPVGHVTSAAKSPTLRATVGLAMVKRGFNGPGQRLTAGAASAEIIATPAQALDPWPSL